VGNDPKAEEALSRFARDIVADAFDEAIEHARLRLAAQVGAETDDRLFWAAAGAEAALAALFANHELKGGFEIQLHANDGEAVDLSDAFGAPLTLAFMEGGWLPQFSKHSDVLMRVLREAPVRSKPSQGVEDVVDQAIADFPAPKKK